MTTKENLHGYINLDKPKGLTSTQALAKVRRILNAAKAGHAGTLDPMATGILPIALGEATKTIEYVQDAKKTYIFEVKWGIATDTDDAEGIVTTRAAKIPGAQEIEKILPKFTGIITQTPPIYSALKINGERAYDLARRGETPDMTPRQVMIDELKLLKAKDESATFEVSCGKGTYIRALARDMALDLGTYGHLTALRRTKVGKFDEKSAISIDSLMNLGYKAPTSGILLSMATVLDDILVLPLDEKEVQKIRQGQALVLTTKADLNRIGDVANRLRLLISDEVPVAIARFERGALRPVKVFNI